MNNAAKNFDILASFSVLHNYFNSLTKLFLVCIQSNFRPFSKTVLSMKYFAENRYLVSYISLERTNYTVSLMADMLEHNWYPVKLKSV